GTFALSVADLFERKLLRSFDRMASKSERSIGKEDVAALSVSPFLVSVAAARSSVVGTGVPDVLPWGSSDFSSRLFGNDESVGALPPVAGGRRTAPRAAGLSTVSRMIGSPSLPLPMTTIFEFGDCASASVASMPRQR